MADPLHLIVLTPSETLIDVEQVGWVHVKLAQDQRLTIWPGHLPVLGETALAELRYAGREGVHSMELPPGIVQVQDGVVTVFLAGAIGDQGREGETAPPHFERLAGALIASLTRESPSHALPGDVP